MLHLSATNDFHGWMDDVYRTHARITNQPLRYAFAPHLNHRFIPAVAVTRPLWLDHFLKDGPALPETPQSAWQLETAAGVPVMRVTPDKASLPVARVDIYYSLDPDPRARFWRDAGARKIGDTWEAKLPVVNTDEPLYAFANVYHTLPHAESLPHLPKITELCLSTLLHSASAAELRAAGVRNTDQSSLLIDDFARGWHDWYRLNAEHKPLWQNWTRKVTDPKWRGPDGAALQLTLTLPESNRLTFVVIENEWRSYRGRKRVFVCDREAAGRAEPQTITLQAADFRDANGNSPANWQQLDQLGICARYEERGLKLPASPARWHGELPKFHRLEWQVPIPRSRTLP